MIAIIVTAIVGALVVIAIMVVTIFVCIKKRTVFSKENDTNIYDVPDPLPSLLQTPASKVTTSENVAYGVHEEQAVANYY